MHALHRQRAVKSAGGSIGALVDQALFASANFAVTVMLARWLSVDAFGAFTVGFTVYLLVGTAHNGLVVEPMLVFGSGRFIRARGSYFAFLVRLHWGSTLLAGAAVLVTAVVAVLLGHVEVGVALGGASLMIPLGLSYWLARRVPYLTAEPWSAVKSGVRYLLLSVTSICLLKVTGWLRAETALVSVGICGLLSAIPLIRLYRRSLSPFGDHSYSYFGDQWSYAKWSMVTGLIGFVPSQGLVLMAPLFLGLGAAATMKVALTPLGPVMQATAALSLLLVPRFVLAAGVPEYASGVRKVASKLILAAFGCSAVIYSFRHELVVLLFGPDSSSAAGVLVYLAWVPGFATAVNVFASSLRAVEAPNLVFASYLIAAAATVVLGWPMLDVYGVNGGATAMLIAYGINATSMWLFSERASRKRQENQTRVEP